MEELPTENPNVEATFDEVLTATTRECDKFFTAEEGKGRYVDMHTPYISFINLRKVRELLTNVRSLKRAQLRRMII